MINHKILFASKFEFRRITVILYVLMSKNILYMVNMITRKLDAIAIVMWIIIGSSGHLLAFQTTISDFPMLRFWEFKIIISFEFSKY